MNLDQYGLPVQSDGDANDQLQRCGMVSVAAHLNRSVGDLEQNCEQAITRLLQIKPGIYTRYVGGSPDNVSADQLIAALGSHVVANDRKQIWLMFKEMTRRFGFAQNYKDGLNDDAKTKIPDFMFLRALPLFTRATILFYPICLITDALLVLSALSACGPVWRDGTEGFARRAPGDVDDNNTILTLAACRHKMPTPFSILSCFLFAHLRPWNYGCIRVTGELTNNRAYAPAYGALRHYHRAESGGNPEIAEMWEPICKKWFTP
jgi:hypothetical protein